MSIYDKYLWDKDNSLKRRVEIDDTLYNELVKLSGKYDATINKLVNIAIMELIKTEDISIYERPENEVVKPHNFMIRESAYQTLEHFKVKYRNIDMQINKYRYLQHTFLNR